MAKRSEGGRLLQLTAVSQAEIAATISVSTCIVSHWISGKVTPSPARRQEIYRAYGVPIESWDQPLGSAGAPAPVPAPAPAKRAKARAAKTKPTAGPLDPMAGIMEEVARYTEMLADRDIPDARKAALSRARVNALKVYAQLQGGSLNEAQIVRLAAFRRVVDAIARALVPWPAAMAAVGKALEQIGDEQ
jgi:transcriptional regulator with XRE-family HTH domain